MHAHNIHPLLASVEACVSALRAECWLQAARSAIRARCAALGYPRGQLAVIFELTERADLVGGQLGTDGVASNWASLVAVNRATVVRTVRRLEKSKLLEILAEGMGPRHWRLRWHLDATQLGEIERATRARIRARMDNIGQLSNGTAAG